MNGLSPSPFRRYTRRRKLTTPEVENSKVLQPSRKEAAVAAGEAANSGFVYSEPMEEPEENLQGSSDNNPTDHGAGDTEVFVRESESECLVDFAVASETIEESDKLVDSEGLPVTEDVVGGSEFVTSDSNAVANAVGTGNPQDKQLRMDLDLRGLASCEGKAAFDLNSDLEKDNECGDGYRENPGQQGEVLEPESGVVSNMVVVESGKLSGGGASGDSQRSAMESPCRESSVTRVELRTASTSSQSHDERPMDVDSKAAESSPQCERNAPFDLNDVLQKDGECGVENLGVQVQVLEPESQCRNVSTMVVEEGVPDNRKLSDGGTSADSQRSSMECPCHESHVTLPEARASQSEGLHSDEIGTASTVQPHDEQPMEVDSNGAESSPQHGRNAQLDLNDTLKKVDECADGYNKNLGAEVEVLIPESCVVSTMVVTEGSPESRKLTNGASGDSQKSSVESPSRESSQPQARASQYEALHSDNIAIASTGQPLGERPMDLDSKGAESSPCCERNPSVVLNDALQKGDGCGDGYNRNLGGEVEVLKPENHVVSTMVVAEGVLESRKPSDGGASSDSQRSSTESPCHESRVTQLEARASHSEGLYSHTIGTASTSQPLDERPLDIVSRGAENSHHCERNVPLDLNDALKKADECEDGHNENSGARVEVSESERHDVSTMVVEEGVPESRKLSGGAAGDLQRSSVGSPCHRSHVTQPEARASQSECLHSDTIATASTDQPHDERPMALDMRGAENSPHCEGNAPLDMNNTLQKGDECGGYNESSRLQVEVLEPECRDVSTMVEAEGVPESRKLSDGGASLDSQRSSMESPCHESHVTQPEVRTSYSEGQPQDRPIGTDQEGVSTSPHRNKVFPMDANESSKKDFQSKDAYYDSLGAPIHVSGTGKEIPLPRVPQHFMGMKDGYPCRLPIGDHLEEAIDDLPPGVQRGPRDYLRGVWDYARKAAHQARVNSLEASLAQKRVRELESQVQTLNQLMEDWRHKALDVMERSSCLGSSLAPILILPVTQTGLPNAEEPCHRLPLPATPTGAPSTSMTATGFTPVKNPLLEGVRGTPTSRPAVSVGLSPTGRVVLWKPDRCSPTPPPSMATTNNHTHPSPVQQPSTSIDATINASTLPPPNGHRVSGSNTNNVEKPHHVRRVRFEGLDDDDGNGDDGKVLPFHVPKRKRTKHGCSSPRGNAPPLH